MCAIGGAFAGWFLQSYFEDKKKKSPDYLAVEKRRDAALAEVRLKTIPCSGRNTKGCNTIYGWDRKRDLVRFINAPNNSSTCPKCNRINIYPWPIPDAEKSINNGALDANSRDGAASQNSPSRNFSEKTTIGIATLHETRTLANQGSDAAQTKLGFMYLEPATGSGVTQDYQEAMKWLRLSAAQGNGTAMFALGTMYHAGLGVAQDTQEAMKWFLSSAGGNPDKQLELLHLSEQAMAQSDWATHHPEN